MGEQTTNNICDYSTLEDLHLHISKFSELYHIKCDKLEQNDYIKLRELLWALTWLSRTLSLAVSERGLTALDMVHKINRIKKYLFDGEDGDIIRCAYNRNLDIRDVNEFELLKMSSHYGYKLIEEEYKGKESLEYYVRILKCLEFLALIGIAVDGYIELKKDGSIFLRRSVYQYQGQAVRMFSEIYTKEYLQDLAVFEKSQFYGNTREEDFYTLFSSVLTWDIRERREKLFLRLSSLAYQTFLETSLVLGFHLNRDHKNHTFPLPFVFFGTLMSTEEKLRKYNEWCKKELL